MVETCVTMRLFTLIECQWFEIIIYYLNNTGPWPGLENRRGAVGNQVEMIRPAM